MIYNTYNENLIALLEGLDVPNPQWWIMQHPEVLRTLGKAISDQAKLAMPDNKIERIGAEINLLGKINS